MLILPDRKVKRYCPRCGKQTRDDLPRNKRFWRHLSCTCCTSSEPCTRCSGCSPNPTCSSGSNCTPLTIELSISGATLCPDIVYDPNRTVTLTQVPSNACLWRYDHPSQLWFDDGVDQATSDIRYAVLKSSATNWICQVFTVSAGPGFFDGAATGSHCNAVPNMNNTIAECAFDKATTGGSATFTVCP